MKAGKTFKIPAAMLFKKFYCHKCGAKLKNNPNKKLVSPKDPDWKKYNNIGDENLLPIGDIEVTEYNFKCPTCGNIIEYEEQRVIANIQKKNGQNVLLDEDFAKDYNWAKEKVENKIKATNIIVGAICTFIVIAGIVCVIVFK